MTQANSLIIVASTQNKKTRIKMKQEKKTFCTHSETFIIIIIFIIAHFKSLPPHFAHLFCSPEFLVFYFCSFFGNVTAVYLIVSTSSLWPRVLCTLPALRLNGGFLREAYEKIRKTDPGSKLVRITGWCALQHRLLVIAVIFCENIAATATTKNAPSSCM